MANVVDIGIYALVFGARLLGEILQYACLIPLGVAAVAVPSFLAFVLGNYVGGGNLLVMAGAFVFVFATVAFVAHECLRCQMEGWPRQCPVHGTIVRSRCGGCEHDMKALLEQRTCEHAQHSIKFGCEQCEVYLGYLEASDPDEYRAVAQRHGNVLRRQTQEQSTRFTHRALGLY